MGLFTKDIKTMDDLFMHTLQDIYYAENQIVKSLPKMIEKATNSSLKQAFQGHLTETEAQVKRLDQAFKLLGHEPKAVRCEAMDGILEEAKSVMGNVADPEVLDAAMLASAQAVEHYEITRYGTLATWANELGHGDVARLFHQTLEEEKRTDEKLSKLAETRLNRAAAA